LPQRYTRADLFIFVRSIEMASHRFLVWTALVLLIAGGSLSVPAQQPAPVSPSLFSEMRWRNIGPMRAGRTKAAAGHPSQPYTFYIRV
jgi:hypothetical protein